MHNRRKAFIYVSNGYDFNPFKDSRNKQEESAGAARPTTRRATAATATNNEETDPFRRQGNEFSHADLVSGSQRV